MPVMFTDVMRAAGHPVRLRPARTTKAARLRLDLAKADEDLRIAWGWASVISEGGRPVVDAQGDVIDPDTLRRAAHGFIASGRQSLRDHSGEPVGEIVESVVLTADVQRLLGVDLGREGWWIALQVHDDATWAAVKRGELSALSIGGRAFREPA